MRRDLVARKRVSEPLVDQPIEARHRQRPEAETISRDPDVDHSDSGVERRRNADGGEQTGAQRSEPPNRERDHPKGWTSSHCRSSIAMTTGDSLDILIEQRMEAGRGGNAANRLAGSRFDARQVRSPARDAADPGALAEQVEVLAEQVEQTGEGELGLGLDRCEVMHRMTACQRTRSNLRPNRRFADPGSPSSTSVAEPPSSASRKRSPAARSSSRTDHPRPACPDRRHVFLGRPWVRSDQRIEAAVDELVALTLLQG